MRRIIGAAVLAACTALPVAAQTGGFLLRNVPHDASVTVNGTPIEGTYDPGRAWMRLLEPVAAGDRIAVAAPLFADLRQESSTVLRPGDVATGNLTLQNRTYLRAGADPAASYGIPFRDCFGCPPMVIVAGGPEQGIAPFAISQSEVTFDSWKLCVADGACNRYTPHDEGYGTAGLPVINVGHADAVAFTEWMSSLDPAFDYRLPTEAEWEFAARGGTTTRYWTGEEITRAVATFDAGAPSRVMSLGANAYDLFDVSGNVWEWTADCWDPQPSAQCDWYAQRGGGWSMRAPALAIENRRGAHASWRHPTVGFRVVRTFPRPEG